jgi:hypothetical protein
MTGRIEGTMERVWGRVGRASREDLDARDDLDAREVRDARATEDAGIGRGSEPLAESLPESLAESLPESYPDPFDDPDTIVELEDRILVLSTHIEVAGHRLLQLVAEFDARRGWELGGHASCAHWLAARAGLDLGTAREKVRVARALEDLPETSAWLGLGRISFSQARALTRVATPDDEAELLEATHGMTTARIERMVRGWRMKSAADALARDEERQRSRCFSIVPDLDGTYVVRGRLTPEQGAVLMRAIEAAGDVLFREETHGQAYEARVPVPGPGTRGRPDTEAAAARRRADAVALLAELSLGAGFGPRRPSVVAAEAAATATGEPGTAVAGAAAVAQADAAKEADAKVAAAPHSTEAPASPSPLASSGIRAGRYQVMLHVEMDALRKDDPTRGAGCSHLHDGIRVSHETSRRLSCDATVVPLFLDAEGRISDAGHARRVVNPTLRRALDARDRGCRFPACGRGHTEAHHIHHWADGGETSLDNCVLLCRHHHRLLHEGGWSMQLLPGGRLVFLDPRGGPHYDGRWTLPRLDEPRRLFPVRELMRENLRAIREGKA